MVRARRRILVVALASLAALLPAEAHAALTWQGIEVLSADGFDDQGPRVEMSPSGDAVAVWQRLDPTRTMIDASLRPAAGNFATPGTAIDNGTLNNENQDVAIGAGGQAQAVWDAYTGSNPTAIFGTPRTAGAAFGTRATVSVSGSGNLHNLTPKTAVDAQGNALSVWQTQFNGGPANYIESAFRTTAGTVWSTVQFPSQDTGGGVTVPQLAMRGAGDAVALWSRTRATFGSAAFPIDDVEANYRSAGLGGTWASASTTLCSGATTASCLTPQIAMSETGEAVAVWSAQSATNPGTGTIQARFRSAGAAGTWGAVQTVATNSSNPQVKMDAQGNAILAYVHATRVETAYRPAGQTFHAGVLVSAVDQSVTSVRLAMSAQGSAIVAWLYDDGSVNHILASDSPSGGVFEPQVEVAAQDPAGDPDVAMDSAGNAVVVWEGNDGSNVVVQSRIGVVPGVVVPPPPPPPPPVPAPAPVPGVPTVTAVRTAAPLTGDSAAVFTADVSGPVDRLEWSVDGGITATAVNGQLPRSIRFHAKAGSLTIIVQAFSGSRAGPVYRRTFAVPRPSARASLVPGAHAASASSDLTAIRAALAKQPPVIAAGDAAVLLGKSNSCAIPTTIRSAQTDVVGCFKPVADLADIPGAERGVLNQISNQLDVPLDDSALMDKAIGLSDGYIAQGQALLNDNWPVVPTGAAEILAFPQANALTSSSASIEVAGQKFGASPKGFSLDLDPKKAGIDLGSLPKPPKLPSIGGFELVGDWNVDLGKQEATIKLPSFITKAGVEIQNSVTLRATKDALIVDNVTVGPISVDLAGLGITGFRISYDRPSDTWTGQGKICVFSGVCLDMTPPNGEIKIKDGRLDFAGASVLFPEPGVPLFTGVNLLRIGFGLGLDPTRMTGNALIEILNLVRLDGRLVVAFPSARTPFVLKADEVGGGFPAKLYGVKFTGPTIGATAALFVTIPELGDIELGSGYFLASYPNYIALGGGTDIKIFDVIEISGSIAGEANIGDGTFNLHGEISGCLLIVTKLCAGAVGNISHGPHSAGGAGLCIGVGPLHVGGGIQWAHPTKPKIWPFDGCKWSPFAIDVRAARAAQAGAPETVVVKKGAPSPAIELDGQGGAPQVHVAGPGGQSLDSTDKGLDYSPGGKIRILRFQTLSSGSTIVGLQNAKPGTYTITPALGSVPITTVSRTTDPPDAKVTGKVSGHGLKRVLTYDVTSRPDQTVTFTEVAGGGAAKTIGTIKGGGKGHLNFTSAPGASRRTIVAQFALDSIPAERKTVTTFMPASPTLGRPGSLRVSRRKTTLTVGWIAATDATRYEIAVTGTGYQRFFTTAKRKLVVRNVPSSVGGRVTVRATDALRQSLTSVRTFKRLAAPKRTIKTLGRCTVAKKKVTCRH